MNKPHTAQVTILDQAYTVACPPESEPQLQRAAQLLNQRMTDIRKAGKVFGTERVAVMAALNLIYELQTQPQGQAAELPLGQLLAKLDQALS
jgi:cell division protein ZapA